MRNILLLAITATCSAIQAQTVCYSYDAAGNRITKFLGPCPPPSSIVSAGGQSTVSDATSISIAEADKASAAAQPQATATGKVYPNPNNGLFELQLDDAPEAGAWFEVYDSKGSLVARQVSDGASASFDLSARAAGEYFLFLRSPSGSTGQWAVVKQD